MLQVISYIASAQTCLVWYLFVALASGWFFSRPTIIISIACVGCLGNVDNDEETSMDKLCEAVGMVFQFPERHFLANSVLEELTFGWWALTFVYILENYCHNDQQVLSKMAVGTTRVWLRHSNHDTRLLTAGQLFVLHGACFDVHCILRMRLHMDPFSRLRFFARYWELGKRFDRIGLWEGSSSSSWLWD